jgi:2-polyprenyl-6-methoxyphenol hydroxylase-like FAD-dependent oxidoreductase
MPSLSTAQPAATHALVIGGGISGLLTARVLLNHFERVTILERDTYPESPSFRPGVPQGHHAHQFLVRGQRTIEEFFPGFASRLLSHGAIEIDFAQDCVYNFGYGNSPRFSSHLRGLLCSRLLIEWQLRQDLLQDARFRLRERCEVVGLITKQGNRVVNGVRLRTRRGEKDHGTGVSAEPETLSADLVVDASGRSSHLPRWLQDLGVEAPSETVVDSSIGYASRWYTIPAQYEDGWKVFAVQGLPSSMLRTGIAVRIEGNRWMILLAGAGKDYPPTDEAGFMQFARSLPDQTIYQALNAAEPLTPIYGYRDLANRARHFERLRALPAALLVIGDAACSFNPIYGQGMTAAAQHALVLSECLHAMPFSSPDFPSFFQRKLAKANQPIWQLATTSDYRLPGTSGPQPGVVERWVFRYMDRILPLCATDRYTFETFLSVIHLIRPATSLFQPAIALKALFQQPEK